jgi:hypothetical protein
VFTAETAMVPPDSVATALAPFDTTRPAATVDQAPGHLPHLEMPVAGLGEAFHLGLQQGPQVTHLEGQAFFARLGKQQHVVYQSFHASGAVATMR